MILPVLTTVLLFSQAHASQFVSLAENKRIEGLISADSMNRIAVANDRITQIFGDEGTFESQNDETTGQVFLKPTSENGTKALSLTLITEQGITQDLTLKPTSKAPTTIVLKNMKPVQDLTETFEKNLPYQEQVLSVLKQAVSGKLPILDGPSVSRPQLSYQQSFQGGPYVLHVFTLEAETAIQEKDFYQAGDVALSFSGHKLYVVARA